MPSYLADDPHEPFQCPHCDETIAGHSLSHRTEPGAVLGVARSECCPKCDVEIRRAESTRATLSPAADAREGLLAIDEWLTSCDGITVMPDHEYAHEQAGKWVRRLTGPGIDGHCEVVYSQHTGPGARAPYAAVLRCGVDGECPDRDRFIAVCSSNNVHGWIGATRNAAGELTNAWGASLDLGEPFSPLHDSIRKLQEAIVDVRHKQGWQ